MVDNAEGLLIGKLKQRQSTLLRHSAPPYIALQSRNSAEIANTSAVLFPCMCTQPDGMILVPGLANQGLALNTAFMIGSLQKSRIARREKERQGKEGTPSSLIIDSEARAGFVWSLH